jgi:transposase-like protein
VLIVDVDVVLVERQLRSGELACPGCGAGLGPWGHGRSREIRASKGSRWRVRPRRARCRGCQATHVLLPEALWPRRTDAAEVIGAGLEIAAAGLGHRRIAARLDRAEDTVRGWVRRFRGRSEEVRRHFTVALVAVADDPVMPEPTGTPVGDAVRAVAAAHAAAAARWPRMLTVSRWAFAGRAIGGRVLTCTLPPI